MRRVLSCVVAFAFLASPGIAASISVMDFSKARYDAARSVMAHAVTEDFEAFGEGNVPQGWSASAVGSFWTVGGTGNGGTVNGSVKSGNFAGNDGSLLAIRDGGVFGRRSTTAALTGKKGDDSFLDSNDTYGIRWDVSIGGMFDRILLTISDAADTGATLRITAGGVSHTLAKLKNGSQQIVMVDFGGPVSGATILFENLKGANRRVNDGFSLDDIAVNAVPSAVPLPATAWMLIAGLGGLGLAARRRRARQDGCQSAGA